MERAEDAMMRLGFSDFRVRLTKDGSARLQLTADQIADAVQRRSEILSALGEDFPAVLLDLQPRRA